MLDKVKRQLETAGRTIEETGVRTRAMERKLRAVEQLPDVEAERVLDLVGVGVVDDAAAGVETCDSGAGPEPAPSTE